ncbi:MAG: oligosaccharide flippase family protein [Cytophagales bacterium]|nr:oligosaccharide flippase family protein [Cytophaga sp.]
MGFAVLLNATIKPINLLLENIVQDKIGHIQYGIFAALNALAFLFIVLLDLGINQFITKDLSSNPDIQSSQLSDYFSLKVVLAVMYPFLMMGVGYILGYSSSEIILLFIISVTYSFYQLVMYLRAKFQASQFFNLDSLASVSDKSILIVLTLALLLMGISVLTYVEARLLSMVVTFLILFLPAWKLYTSKSFQLRWNHPSWQQILKQTYPFALITILFSMHDKIDQVMIERMLGDHASGLYAGAYRWLDAFMMFLWIVLPIFFARFSYVRKNPDELSGLLSMAQIVSAIPMIIVTCFVWFYGENLFFLLGNSTPFEIEEMTLCLKILFSAVMIHAFFACLGTLLSATGGEHFINRMLVISILINVVLNVFLLPAMGISGAALATVISNLFVSGSYVYFIYKNKHVQINYAITVKLMGIAVLCTAASYFIHSAGILWWQAGILLCCITSIAAFALGLHKVIRKI